MEEKIARIVKRVQELTKSNIVYEEIVKTVPIIVNALVDGKVVLRSVQWNKKDFGKISVSEYGIFYYRTDKNGATSICLSTDSIENL